MMSDNINSLGRAIVPNEQCLMRRGNKADCPKLRKDELVYFMDTCELAIGIYGGAYSVVARDVERVPIIFIERGV